MKRTTAAAYQVATANRQARPALLIIGQISVTGVELEGWLFLATAGGDYYRADVGEIVSASGRSHDGVSVDLVMTKK